MCMNEFMHEKTNFPLQKIHEIIIYAFQTY